ncbi:MAG: tRNA preQ1(34) S-adenosylmethionine ribosyltransferase-isomerase QueA [Clostridia bacterium]|nr:tRNA preQ1(34) S-adenosylmethionine ribosyltransferase-isomerase QueA [Clostridia bacterium]
MRVEDFDYDLPEDRIAQAPLPDRDAARLMVLRRTTREIEDRRFFELPELLAPGDLLVLNDTRVLPARLVGRRATGGTAELLLLHPEGRDGEWRALARPHRRLRAGETLSFERGLRATLIEKAAEGEVVVRLEAPGGWEAALREAGRVPLPPYIRRPLEDPERYQTVYAREEGSAAAPTAGLHFTPRLLEALQARGVETAYLTLHVGLGTFRPVHVERIDQHRMHAEWYRLPPETAAAVARARERGGRVVAVGTTVCRTLETRATDEGLVEPGSGWTDLFIYPGFRFRVVDALVTNFHLPKSTLLMLVSAFAGREFVLSAYRRAVESGYRFYSFGDAMLIL